jgi:hypothetical protein
MYGQSQLTWGRAIELSENARFTLFRPSEFKADLYLTHLSLKGFVEDTYFNIADELANYIDGGGLKDMIPSERESFDFFYKQILTSLKVIGNVALFPKINDKGDLLLRIKPTKDRFKKFVDDDK